MSDTLFNQPDQGNNEPTGQRADQATLFKVGDRTYDADSAAKKIENADAFIEQLKAEKRELEAQVQQSKSLEEAMSMFQQQQQQQQPQQAVQTESVDMEAIKAALLAEARQAAQNSAVETWRQQQASATSSNNFNESINAVKQAYGDDYTSKLMERGTELGYDQAGIDALAKSNPKVFKELFVPKTPQYNPSPNSQSRSVMPNQRADLSEMIPDFSKSWSSGDKVTQLREAEAKIVEQLNSGKLSI